MATERPQASTEQVLRLVQTALDAFESDPLESSVRRTIRIANLLGDTFTSLRLSLELRPTGGHPPGNAEMTRRLMSDPAEWGVEGGVADRAMTMYIEERKRSDGLISSHSIGEIDFWMAELPATSELADHEYRDRLASQTVMLGILSRTRHHVFTLLCKWERELTFSVNQIDALASVRARVDGLLADRAPDALDMLNAAMRRLRDSAEQESPAAAGEELSQALTSCRRIMKAVVDVVHPADPAKPESEDGHAITDEQYKNRLVEFLKSRVSSTSFRGALEKSGEALFSRFSTTDSLASKGVHARVLLEEAEFCALQTYVLAGEILLLAEGQSAPSEV